MSAIFALANQKGGVAKTTTTGILAAGLKKQGFSVLTIDCDPQGNLSMSVAAENQDSATMYEVMKGTVSARDAIQHTPSCDIIPANTILAGIEQELHNVGKEMTLREKLRDEQIEEMPVGCEQPQIIKRPFARHGSSAANISQAVIFSLRSSKSGFPCCNPTSMLYGTGSPIQLAKVGT